MAFATLVWPRSVALALDEDDTHGSFVHLIEFYVAGATLIISLSAISRNGGNFTFCVQDLKLPLV